MDKLDLLYEKLSNLKQKKTAIQYQIRKTETEIYLASLEDINQTKMFDDE